MSREEAIQKVTAFRNYLMAGNPIWDVDEVREAFNMAIEALAIDPVKHGRWIEYPDVLQFPDVLDESYIGCSQCKNVFSVIDNCTERFNYCPNCGAKMDEVTE